MKPIIWVLVNSNNLKEAKKIGGAVLKTRLASCYGMYPKIKSVYFWPPHSNRLEKNSGPLLVMETLPENYNKITKLVKQLHSDKVPFIGKIKIDGIGKEFYNWMAGELK